MKYLSTLAIVTTVALFGCAGAPPQKTITIDSDPSGVRIEVNNAYIGQTPTSYTLQTNPQGEFLGSWANAPQVIFVATPSHEQTNLFIQKKTFEPNGFFKAGDKIPERIFFDMYVKPQ